MDTQRTKDAERAPATTCSMLRRVSRLMLVAYLGAVIVAGVMGASRLTQSTDMPGLAAIEIVLLALPLSLALGVEPLSHFGWTGMGAIVLAGLAVNAGLLWKLSAWRAHPIEGGPE